MEQKIVIRSPGVPPSEHPIADAVVIGRDAGCDIQVPSQYVSRRHIQLEPEGEGLILTDLGGRNPVLLNGVPISGSATARPGDSIGIADVVIDVAGLDPSSLGTVVFPASGTSGGTHGGQGAMPAMAPAPRAAPAGPGVSAHAGLQSVWTGQDLGPGGTLTIMFTDLERSTSMVTELGEREAYKLMRAHNVILRDQFNVYRGHEAKRQGDGFLVLFASARDALNCSIAIQRNMRDEVPDSSIPLRVRIGLHVGEVLWDENDIYGAAVNFAARVNAQADGGEILISALLREVVAPSGEFTFGTPRTTPLKGFKGEHTLTPVEY